MGLFNNALGNQNELNRQHSAINWKYLTDRAQLDEIIALSHESPILIFKHSTRCGISRMVLKQFESEFALSNKVTAYFLDLLEHRDISNAIAEEFRVVHQSPQLLLIKDGTAIYNASHDRIDAQSLESKI